MVFESGMALEDIGDVPAVRGRAIQKLVGRIDELGRSDIEQLQAQHGATLDFMRRTQAEGWYAQARYMPVLESLAVLLGPRGYFDFHREGARRALQGPLMSAVQEGSMRLFALEPRGVFMHTPAMWKNTLRNSGHLDPLTFSDERTGERSARATLREVPPSLLRVPPPLQEPVFLVAIRALLAATFDICSCPGQVERLAGGDPWVFEARW